MKLGDEIIWFGVDADPSAIRRGVVTRMQGADLCWVNGHHAPEDCIFQYLCWPASVEDELVLILQERQRLKKVYDDSMSMLYQLRNRISREGH